MSDWLVFITQYTTRECDWWNKLCALSVVYVSVCVCVCVHIIQFHIISYIWIFRYMCVFYTCSTRIYIDWEQNRKKNWILVDVVTVFFSLFCLAFVIISFRTHVVSHFDVHSIYYTVHTFDPFGAAHKMVFIPLQIVYHQLSSQQTRIQQAQKPSAHKYIIKIMIEIKLYLLYRLLQLEPMSPGEKQIQSKIILKVNNLWRHKTFTFNLQMGFITLHLFAIVSLSLCLSVCLSPYIFIYLYLSFRRNA